LEKKHSKKKKEKEVGRRKGNPTKKQKKERVGRKSGRVRGGGEKKKK